MKPKLLISIGCRGKANVGFLGCQTSGTSDKWNCLSSWIVRQVGHQTNCIDLSLHYQKKDPLVALGTPSVVALKICIKDFTKLVEQRISLRISTIRGKLFPYYIHICVSIYTYIYIYIYIYIYLYLYRT